MMRNGVDIIEIDRLAKINPKIRERFIQRVFTKAEQSLCDSNNTCLAGRFAAKEAVAKALGTGIGAIRWKDIEILRGEEGQPVLFLHGNAKKKEAELKITQWALSISHNKTLAIAFVIAS